VIAATASTNQGQAKGIDKSILTVAAPRRYRNREHLRYVMQQPCLICGRKPSDPALHAAARRRSGAALPALARPTP
jgi:hypothetical protein